MADPKSLTEALDVIADLEEQLKVAHGTYAAHDLALTLRISPMHAAILGALQHKYPQQAGWLYLHDVTQAHRRQLGREESEHVMMGVRVAIYNLRRFFEANGVPNAIHTVSSGYGLTEAGHAYLLTRAPCQPLT